MDTDTTITCGFCTHGLDVNHPAGGPCNAMNSATGQPCGCPVFIELEDD